ncbi:MAG: F0F1 ATP synthase subunit B [Steroidobacteraceae bacterium]
MNINLTLVIQMAVFVLLVLSVMRWVWPPIIGAIDERSRKIAMGLAAAEKGKDALVEAEQRSQAALHEARERAHQIVEQAQRRASEMVEQAKGTAAAEAQRLVTAAQQQIALEAARVRESLRKDVAALAVETASKLLEREIDPRGHADLLDKLAAQI